MGFIPCYFFSFLRKSNLVLPTPNVTSPKVPRRLDLDVSPNGAFLHIRVTKTIQSFPLVLSIPLPIIPGSLLCPVTALINHLRLNSVGPSDSLFSVRSPSNQSTQPITYYHFSKFLATVVMAFGLDTRDYSQHSFRRGGASFAFACNVPAELRPVSNVVILPC